MNRRAAIIVAGILMVGAVVGWAPAASAATPRCTGIGWRMLVYSNGTWDENAWTFFPAHSPTAQVWGGQGYWSCSLVQGSTGAGVKQLQRDMNFCYETVIPAPLEEDGQFGQRTKDALVKVQQYLSIEFNGQYGPQTARTMRHRFVDSRYGFNGCLTLSDTGWPGNSG
jgi:hypothetical protein